jgi:hypothetical protein
VNVDLGMAEVDGPESTIIGVAVLGGIGIVAPPGVAVQLSGFSLFGGKADKRHRGPALRGSPAIRVRAFPVFGGITVKDSTWQRKLRDAVGRRRS